MKTLTLLITLTTLLAFTGCANKTKQTQTQQTQTEQTEAAAPSVKKTEIKTLYLKITHEPSVNADGAYLNAEKELSETIIKKLRVKMRRTNIITTQKPANGLEANIVISEFNYIGTTPQPFPAAATPERAKLGAKLTVTDIATGKSIRKAEFGTSAKFSEGIFGGTSTAQIENLADKIVSRIN
ncbi:MAG: hypothetical protein EOO52_15255 [Gammaproteobacteria bacterium]|nr:MAG: hypothetical protein EOO52_15255 [Gammaproteobacteria bacterium]